MNSAFSRTALMVDSTAGTIARLYSDIEVAARTTLPVRGCVVVNFQRGVGVSTEVKSVGENP